MINPLRILSAVIPGLPSINGVMLAIVMGGLVTGYFWHSGKVAEAGRVGERKGETRTIKRVKKANDQATKLGRRAASKSGRSAPVGVCPTGYRNC